MNKTLEPIARERLNSSPESLDQALSIAPPFRGDFDLKAAPICPLDNNEAITGDPPQRPFARGQPRFARWLSPQIHASLSA